VRVKPDGAFTLNESAFRSAPSTTRKLAGACICDGAIITRALTEVADARTSETVMPAAGENSTPVTPLRLAGDSKGGNGLPCCSGIWAELVIDGVEAGGAKLGESLRMRLFPSSAMKICRSRQWLSNAPRKLGVRRRPPVAAEPRTQFQRWFFAVPKERALQLDRIIPKIYRSQIIRRHSRSNHISYSQ